MCVNWETVDTENAFFLGCTFAGIDEEIKLRRKGAHFFAAFSGLPYNPYRTSLYTPAELMLGYEHGGDIYSSLDAKIYRHFQDHGGHDADIVEALVQRIHDYSMDAAMKRLLKTDPVTGLPARKAVGFMGGHVTRRDDPHYRKTAVLARLCTRAGYFAVSGGGPGIMEAANLGAYLATADDTAIDRAIEILAAVPNFALPNGTINPGYVGQALKVLKQYEKGAESLAVPTWFYGHEPVNMFASHVGKYFSNSIREDGLLAISTYGVVFSPGSAATIEEVFINAAQNHYAVFNFCSPMMFLGTTHYLQSQVYSCLAQQAVGHEYAKMIMISDEPEEVLRFLQKNPPINLGYHDPGVTA
jgi:predicted Rossmann-fold nucleotide-binding protein